MSKFILIFLTKIFFIASSKDLYEKDELDALIRLPRKEFLINDGNQIIREIIDICFAFLYEYR